MCGIFGYCNYNKPKTTCEILNVLGTGLKRLEYRGYDSAGMAVVVDGAYKTFKQTGKVQVLVDHVEKECKSFAKSPPYTNHVGVAHTRWATHGEPSERNSHPIPSQDNEFFVVHNGIINNWKSLKEILQKHGYVFNSETDTECISQLILFIYRKGSARGIRMSFTDLVNEAVHRLDGAFAFLVVSKNYPNEIVAARRGSPLLVGVAGPSIFQMDCIGVDVQCKEPKISIETPVGTPKLATGTSELSRSVSRVFVHGADQPEKSLEIYFSSDQTPIIEYTNKILTLEDGDLAHVSEKGLEIIRSVPGGESSRPLEEITGELGDIMKGSYPHFMLKEIHEQKDTIMNTMRGRVNFEKNNVMLGGVASYLGQIRRSTKLIFIACGTSYYACLHMRGLFEELTGIPTVTEVASDFNDRLPPISRTDCCVFVSQSGETADSLISLKYVQDCGAITIGVTNVVGSSISKRTDCGIHINAGPEIGVASTKAYTSQSVALAMLAVQIGQDNSCNEERRKEVIQDMLKLSEGIASVLKDEPGLKKLSEDVLKYQKSIILLGRGYQLATCLEGALKIKEISYIHSEGIGAGELKHGPLALVEEHLCIIMILTDPEGGKSNNAYQQVRTRGGNPIVICTEKTAPLLGDSFKVIVPEVNRSLQGIINVVVLQLLAYHTATSLGFDVDKPRNLAKSVTVE